MTSDVERAGQRAASVAYFDEHPMPPKIVIEQARCRAASPGLFFSERGEPAQCYEAKLICHECPVEDLCLEHALEHEYYGVWGGTSEKERRILRRQIRLRRASAVSTAGSAVKSPARVPHRPASGSPTDVEVRWPRHINNAGHHSSGERLA